MVDDDYTLEEKLHANSIDLFMKDQLDYIYHYTSVSAIHSIIDSKQLWISNFRYLNDPNEIVFGLEVIKSIIEREAFFKLIDVNDLFDEIVKKYESVHDLFILSYTKKEDSLTQWFGYGDHGLGVSIRFCKYEFEKILRKNRRFVFSAFCPVYYYQKNIHTPYIPNITYSGKDTCCKDFEQNIKNGISLIMDEYVSSPSKIKSMEMLQRFILIYSSMIKTTFFSEEYEYRLIICPTNTDTNITSVCINSKSRLVYKLELSSAISKCINQIMIGPKCNENDYKSIRVLADTNGINKDSVQFSSGLIQ